MNSNENADKEDLRSAMKAFMLWSIQKHEERFPRPKDITNESEE